MKTLIIDNYDSFTNNLYQIVAEINKSLPIIIRNDTYSFDDLKKLDFDNILISPGPGNPENTADFGVCARVLMEMSVPILGVCLGHQGLAHVYGGTIKKSFEPMHGRIDKIFHNGDDLFRGIPKDFFVTRYHSLIVDEDSLPPSLEIIAKSFDGTIMGICHLTKPQWGVQYHPESIVSEYGRDLLKNFMLLSKSYLREEIYKKKIELNRPLRELAVDSTCAKTRSAELQCTLVHGDSSIESTNQVESAVEFPKRSNVNNTSKVVTNYKLLVKKIANIHSAKLAFNYLFAEKKSAVWLDSSLSLNEKSRFSIMGCLDGEDAYLVKYDVNNKIVTCVKGNTEVTYSMSIFDFLKMELERNVVISEELPFKFKCGFIGYFGYELYSETLSIAPKYLSKHPDAQFLFLDRAIVFDHQEKNCFLLMLSKEAKTNLENSWFIETERSLKLSQKKVLNINLSVDSEVKINREIFSRNHEEYISDINACLNYIKNGESYEICLTNRVTYTDKVDPLRYYLLLREVNQAPYAAFLKFDDLGICSASVELFLSIDKFGNVETKPIKGTLPRGSSLEEDRDLIDKLKKDEKFSSENLMIVDLLRHDLGGVCEIGSVFVPKLMDVETYSTVHQLVTTIRGKLREDLSPIDCIIASFPGGSMTGAPKRRTIEIINKLEQEERGIYSGAIGYISLDGATDLNIVIRTAIITPEKLSIGVGGAIIYLSDPEEEYQEILLKLKGLKKSYNDCKNIN